ncbi:DUF7316 family protein [Rhodococcus daqingensis]|uniref:Uncharacterized protein n=1 Tax=Rhodococcus daqingensis TaxID=2479363 RepID=A0ABW2S2Y2_9NOCA
MTNISATVEVVTEYGIRTPDGEIHWVEFTPPPGGMACYAIHPDQPGQLQGLAKDLAKWARDSHLDVDAVLTSHALVERQITIVRTDPTLVDNLRQHTGIDAATPVSMSVPSPRPTSPF